jgi:hypothetical protein
MNLDAIFDRIVVPQRQTGGGASFAARPLPTLPAYLLGKDDEGRACLLIETKTRADGGKLAPIRLNNLDAEFNRKCLVVDSADQSTLETYTVIRCRASDRDTIHYFLWICETLVRIVGNQPNAESLKSIVTRLASIFQQLDNPPTQPVVGLFGELFVIFSSSDTEHALSLWRLDPTSRFDFAGARIRLEVKATSARVRSHMFSYDQCNPPSGTMPIVASLLTEITSSGVALRTLIDAIVNRIGDPNLILKLQEGVASTLGSSLQTTIETKFDMELAQSSLRLFRMTDIPAIRGELESGVSDVHFKVDLSGCVAPPYSLLAAETPEIMPLLPRADALPVPRLNSIVGHL